MKSSTAATNPRGGKDESWAEVWAETGAGQPLPQNHPLVARRAEVDRKALAESAAAQSGAQQAIRRDVG